MRRNYKVFFVFFFLSLGFDVTDHTECCNKITGNNIPAYWWGLKIAADKVKYS